MSDSDESWSCLDYLPKGPLHCIGAGGCGSVWSPDYDCGGIKAKVFKRHDGATNRSLPNEYHNHLLIAHALRHCPEDIRNAFRIPLCLGFAQRGEIPPFVLQSFLQNFPPDERHLCDVMTLQRIPPLDKNVRDMLCDKYCPPQFIDKIKADPKSVDCMIRPYLGLRRDPRSSNSRQSAFQSFSLRNHIVSVDQMDELGVDFEIKQEYAVAMAKALAFMHWCARIDANDIEFVLAPPAYPTWHDHEVVYGRMIPVREFNSKSLGSHCLWILDFDRCKPLAMNEDGIALAKKAFYRNDLYYPRPGRVHPEDQRLWMAFKRSFLEASIAIIKSGPPLDAEPIPKHLPFRLLEAIESGNLPGQMNNSAPKVRLSINR